MTAAELTRRDRGAGQGRRRQRRAGADQKAPARHRPRRQRRPRPTSTTSASCRCSNTRSSRPGPRRTDGRIGLGQYAGLEQALEERANELYDRLSAGAAGRRQAPVRQPRHARRGSRGHAGADRAADRPGDAGRRSRPSPGARPASSSPATTAGGRSAEVSHEALIRHWEQAARLGRREPRQPRPAPISSPTAQSG